MNVQEWLGKDNQLGIDIWQRKYQHNGETFDQWLDRISAGDNELRDLIISKKFLFGGRILSNRGLNKEGIKTTYSNCYVIAPPEDNIESIYDCAKKLARTYSYGGGCGVDISKLAPRGAKVNNSAKETSGSISFMDLYNLTTELIGQNGRRGALMLSLACNHPDLEEFISIKTDLNKINKANISIRIFDEFMECVKHDREYCLSFTRSETDDTITKMVNARNIFRKICEANWDYAEPGMLFWDAITEWNLLSEDPEFEYAGTNPCLTGDTLISTPNGNIPIDELVGETPDVYCMDESGNLTVRRATKVWKTRENASIILVKTIGHSIKCTPDHLVHTKEYGWVKACNLKIGDVITGAIKISAETDLPLEIGHSEDLIVRGVFELDETVDVYDMTVPGVHNFVANQMIVHNCAEEP